MIYDNDMCTLMFAYLRKLGYSDYHMLWTFVELWVPANSVLRISFYKLNHM
jgi:hypothetical protein